jgi:succinyl-CoA synthetase alpha subunit
MAVLVDESTRLCVAGITGREGSFHTLNNRRYGTNVVGGVTPGKGGQDVEGIPVFDSWEQAMESAQPNTAMIFVPPRFAADSILEAAAAGVELVIAITEGIPAHDELRVYNTLERDHPNTRLIGPNCPGILSPGKANVGIIPASFFSEGNVGVVSRSGTLTYQIGSEIAQAGFGCSSIVGIGGDPVPGSSFVDILELFEADGQTELVVLSGEIGGSAEEEAAEYIAAHMSKPVVAYIAGFTAPAGKQMGHAGAIVSGSAGTAAAKAQALEANGVRRAHPHRGRGDRRGDARRRAHRQRLSDMALPARDPSCLRATRPACA